MQKTYNILVKAATAVLAMILAAGCVFEKEDPAGFDKKKDVMVLLDIKTSEMETKADVIYSDPTEAEENLSTVRIYAFDSSTDKMIGYADNKSATDGVFHMLLRVPSDAAEITADFYVVANEGAMYKESKPVALVENMSKSELEAIVFNSLTPNTTDIPMYGILEGKKLNLTAGTPHDNEIAGHAPGFKLTESVNVGLTRSLAKIEVYAAESASATTAEGKTEDTSVTITGVSLANVPASGNLFTAPDANTTIAYTDFNDTEVGTGYSSSFHNGGTVNKKVDGASKNDTEEPNNYTLVSDAYYLAENNQGATEGDFGADSYPIVGVNGVEAAATVLKIDYNVGGTDKTGYVKMPQIKRNTWYKVLARITAGKEIKLNIVALPWNDAKDQTIDFLDNVTLKNSGWDEGDGFTDDSQNAKLSFGPGNDKAATFKFTLDTPRGGTWYATIAEGDIQNFAFIDKNNNEVKTVSGYITGAEQSFTIKPLESLSMGEKKSVILRLVAVTEDKSRSLTVKFGSNDFYTIEQAYNVTNN